MQTISTLCATSTVGIAACGLALALPHYGHLPVAFNSSTPPLIEESIDGQHTCTPANESTFSQLTPTSACIASAHSRSSTSRKWLRRLSESFSSSPGSSLSSSSPSSTISSTSSSSRTRSWAASQPSSRPPTRNKLVKRSPAERLSRANSPVPPPRLQRRPSTAAIYQPPTAGEQLHSNPPSPYPVERPSTSGLDLDFARSRFGPPNNTESVDVWRPFFPAKRQKNPQLGSGPTKLKKKSTGIRRIVPDFFRRSYGPTLVSADAVDSSSHNPSDKTSHEFDTNSLYTDTASTFYIGSRPVSQQMGETQQQLRGAVAAGGSTRQRSSTASFPARFSSRRKSFSFSNLLGVATHKNIPTETNLNDDDINGGLAGRRSMGGGSVVFARRHSTSDALNLPYHSYRNNSRPTTAALDQMRRISLPPIQSLSLLDLGFDEQPSEHSETSPDRGAQSEEQQPQQQAEGLQQPEHGSVESLSSVPAVHGLRRHRLSIMSASERASTLIGSESEHDFGSDTLFDSIRTRISEMTPIRADRIFDTDRCYDTRSSPLHASYDDYDLPHTTTTTTSTSNTTTVPTKATKDRANSSPNDNTHTAQRLGVEDEEEDAWSSDWDIPSKPAGDEHHHHPHHHLHQLHHQLHHRLSGPGLRPYNSRTGLGLHSNGSNTSFGTAREGWSADGSSMRETNSILDWNDGVSVHTSTSSNGYRPKTVHAKESNLSSTRTGRRAPSIHVRSQSMPVVNTLRGRTPLPSENWDDDFLDEDDEFGTCKNEMVIPRAIEERQASIIGHLGCVREFALLVEDLKRLRELAVAKGIRNKADSDMWDEADGIIALATLDDDEEDAPLKKETLHRQNTWSPQRRRELSHRLSDENNAYTLSTRHSALSLEDDIFGSNENLSSTPKYRASRHLSPAPSTTSPVSRKTIDRNDPIEVAKSMMEKMQHRQRSDASRRNSTGLTPNGKVHFDTDMLRDLVVQTGRLKQKLIRAVDGFPPSPERGGLRLKLRTMETPTDEKFDFDLSPIKSTFDENLGGLERVSSKGMGFSPAIGVV